MPYIKVEGQTDQKGTEYWGGDRLERMIATQDIPEGPPHLLPDGINSVIDLGSGIGRRRKHFPGMRYVGVDREDCMIENGRKVYPGIELYQCDLMELIEIFPQFKELFDLAFTFHAVQYNHSLQQLEIFRNIYEVIVPNGFYYMIETDHDCPRDRVPKDKFEIITTAEHGHTLFKKI